jgi:hypothetical protein
MAIDETFEGTGEFAAQAVGLIELPIVEVRAIAQAETCQKVAVVESYRVCERVETGGTGFGWPVMMELAFSEAIVESVYIDLEVGIGIQADGLAVNFEPGTIEGFVERREGAA